MLGMKGKKAISLILEKSDERGPSIRVLDSRLHALENGNKWISVFGAHRLTQ
jgi:hypothetical protein